jgi:HEPN domain
MIEARDVFERRKKLSIYWHNKASDLRGSAGALWASMHDPDAYAVAEELGFVQGFSFSVACFPIYHMLCGMALELLLKAIIVAQGDAPKATHDLVALSRDAAIQLTDKHSALLKILSAAIIWEGRYPVPKQKEHFYRLSALRFEHLYDPLPSAGTLNIRRPNGKLRWESFNELWNLVFSVYEHHC